uniref:Uncharacterized protein n=1 Tax=Anopheles melas TaxID=34690 RepID=A0A182TIM7_9DIPT
MSIAANVPGNGRVHRWEDSSSLRIRQHQREEPRPMVASESAFAKEGPEIGRRRQCSAAVVASTLGRRTFDMDSAAYTAGQGTVPGKPLGTQSALPDTPPSRSDDLE